MKYRLAFDYGLKKFLIFCSFEWAITWPERFMFKNVMAKKPQKRCWFPSVRASREIHKGWKRRQKWLKIGHIGFQGWRIRFWANFWIFMNPNPRFSKIFSKKSIFQKIILFLKIPIPYKFTGVENPILSKFLNFYEP